MTKVDKVVFLKNPNEVLEQVVKNFIKESEFNRRVRLDQGFYWDEPLVGFASGMDPLFFEYIISLPDRLWCNRDLASRCQDLLAGFGFELSDDGP